MTPTVGRIVHYQPFFTTEHEAEPRAAIVTAVNGDGTVNLFVFGPSLGDTLGLDSVRHACNDDPTEGRWNWPPR
ncbi:hypothetical protein FGG44_gp02 [Mycobacterium phage MacnCheese]|uniref:Uncharacterized protein n=1 Tax=Mycobacterium phage MacnCheese TaxID=2927982 RepID=I6X3F9_9CAUD|nr:hypothetical protein FGG44_gp02 [Mycobacterium phage MacnCheese]AFN37792.1 hypothetical protein MACNCHEESE_2 [Mycobacterium phage MacnCheese]